MQLILSQTGFFFGGGDQERIITSGGSRIFPRGGREPSRGGVNTPNFPENCMKSKEFGRPGGGVRPSRPPLDPPMITSLVSFNCFSLDFIQIKRFVVAFHPKISYSCTTKSNSFYSLCYLSTDSTMSLVGWSLPRWQLSDRCSRRVEWWRVPALGPPV